MMMMIVTLCFFVDARQENVFFFSKTMEPDTLQQHDPLQPSPSRPGSQPQCAADATPVVMTKRAIRRRIVKAWEKKKKELREQQQLESNLRMTMNCDDVRGPMLVSAAEAPKAVTQQKAKPTAHRLQLAATVARRPHLLRNSEAVQHNVFRPWTPAETPFSFFFEFPQTPSSPSSRSPGGDLRTDEDRSDVEPRQFGESIEATRPRCPVDPNFISLVRCADQERTGSTQREDQNADAPSAILPIPSPYSAASAPSTTVRPVIRRVDRQDPLPMLSPFAPGTDLNAPTPSYLSLDPTWGTHRSAPGFYRESATATSTLLKAAADVFARDAQQSVNVISTGDAMARLFETSYRPSQPFTLHVHRIGPAVVVHAPETAEEHAVDQARKKALLSKALYRLRDHAEEALRCGSQDAAPTAMSTSLVRADGDTGLPRAGTVSFAEQVQDDPRLHNYGSVLHWGIHALGVLVGLDTPILVDRDQTELTLALSDASVYTPDAVLRPGNVQLDALRCWFEATLANVANVGFCVHNHGEVQSYQLKKVSDLLSLVEGQVAASAMAFTTHVLRWLLEQCTEDGTDYVVLRDVDSDMLELYAIHSHTAGGRRSAGSRIAAEDVDTSEPEDTPEGKSERAPRDAPAGGRSRKAKDLGTDMTLALLCYQMGLHFISVDKASEAFQLMMRALHIFFEHTDRPDVAAPIQDICARFAPLLETTLSGKLHSFSKRAAEEALLSHDRAGEGTDVCVSFGGVAKALQEAMFACIRVEEQLRRLYELPSEQLCVLDRSTIAPLLLRCSAGVSVVVSAALKEWGTVRDQLCCAKKAVRHRQHDSRVQLLTIALKDTIQIVLEGIVVLERIYAALVPSNPAGLWSAGSGSSPTDGAASVANVAPESPRLQSALVEVRAAPTKIESTKLSSIACELLGDVYLSILADPSSGSGDAVAEISQCMLTRMENSAASRAFDDPMQRTSGSQKNSDPQQDASSPPCAATSCLRKLRAIPSEPTALCHTAIVYYSRPRAVARRLLQKASVCYFLVGKRLHATHRWTKALEYLQHCADTLAASEVAAVQPDHGFPQTALQSTTSWLDLYSVMGQTYLQMAMLRRDQAHRANPQTYVARKKAFLATVPESWLAGVVAVPFDDEEERHMSSALSAFTAAYNNCDGTRSTENHPQALEETPTGLVESLGATSVADAYVLRARLCVCLCAYAVRLIGRSVCSDSEAAISETYKKLGALLDRSAALAESLRDVPAPVSIERRCQVDEALQWCVWTRVVSSFVPRLELSIFGSHQHSPLTAPTVKNSLASGLLYGGPHCSVVWKQRAASVCHATRLPVSQLRLRMQTILWLAYSIGTAIKHVADLVALKATLCDIAACCTAVSDKPEGGGCQTVAVRLWATIFVWLRCDAESRGQISTARSDDEDDLRVVITSCLRECMTSCVLLARKGSPLLDICADRLKERLRRALTSAELSCADCAETCEGVVQDLQSPVAS